MVKLLASISFILASIAASKSWAGLDEYCAEKSAYACQQDPESSICQLAINQCKTIWHYAFESQRKAVGRPTFPALTFAQVATPKMCAHGACKEALESQGPPCPEHKSEPKKVSRSKKWKTYFSIESVLRVQTGTKVNVDLSSMQYLDVKKMVKDYAKIKKSSIDQVLKASGSDFKSTLGLSNEVYAVANIVRNTISMHSVDAQAYLIKQRNSLNFDQKVQIIASILNLWHGVYDTKRYETSIGSGRASADDMMGAVIDNLNGKDTLAGICRDDHQEIIAYAQALGLIGYGTGYANAEGAHRTLVLMDPKDRTKIVRANYGHISVTPGCNGPSCLDERGLHGNIGIRNRGWSAQDEFMYSLPSSLGASLHRASGGKASDLFPLYEYEDSYIEGKINHGPFHHGVFFSATPLTGRSVVGINSYSDELTLGPVSGGAGMSIFKGQADGVSISGVYAQGHLKLSSPTLRLGEVESKAYLKTNGEMMYGKARGIDESDGEVYQSRKRETSQSYEIGVELKNEDQEFKMGAKTWINTEQSHTRARDPSGFYVGATLPVISYSYDTRFKVTKGIDGKVDIDGSVVLLDTGAHPINRGSVTVGSKKVAGGLSLERSWRSDTPLFLPGAGAKAQASVHVSIKDDLIVGSSFGVNECAQIGTCFFATGSISYTPGKGKK